MLSCAVAAEESNAKGLGSQDRFPLLGPQLRIAAMRKNCGMIVRPNAHPIEILLDICLAECA